MRKGIFARSFIIVSLNRQGVANTLLVPDEKPLNGGEFSIFRETGAFVNLPFYMVIRVNFTKTTRAEFAADK